MRFASFLSTDPSIDVAVAEVTEQLEHALSSVDLLFVHVTADHREDATEALQELAARCPDAVLVGCEGGGVLASGLEIEGASGLAVLAAELPGAELAAVHLDGAMLDSEGSLGAALRPLAEVPRLAGVLVLSDPFTFDLARFLPAATAALPDVPWFGGQASGRAAPGPHRLWVRGEAVAGGAVCVAFGGHVALETVVAQGCRPIGPPMFVTRCRRNLLLELDGRPPVEVLKELYDGLSPDDQHRFRDGQFLGIQMRDQTEYERGDFVIRHVLGVPEDGRGLAIAAPLEQYQVVQFHVRDARTSHDDLLARLERRQLRRPAGALLFTCLGRGRGLYGEPHHDSRCFHEEVGEVALAGFFANGELGPVQGQAHVHGYTSVFVLFASPDAVSG